MSHQEMVAYINEENRRRKRKRIVLTKMYFEVSMLALAYVSTQRAPRDLGAFTEFEEKFAYRKYVLRRTYNGKETRCYDELRLTKRNFHDLCAMLREKWSQRYHVCDGRRKSCYVLTSCWAWN